MTTERAVTGPTPARVQIQDGDTIYSCQSPDRERALEFIQWFLSDVHGSAVVDIRYDQRDAPLTPIPPDLTGAKK